MAFEYQQLTPQERLSEVDNRLTSMERSHYQARLNVIVSTDEGTTTANQTEANALEQQIILLREERDAVQQQVDAAQPA